MVWGKIIGQATKREGALEGKPIRDYERLESAFLRMTMLVKESKDFNLLLEHVARESLHCLLAHRSSIFAVDAGGGDVNAQYSFADNPQHEQQGVLEEREVARRAAKQNKTYLLREPKDLSEFLKYGERERKLTSLISIPLPDGENPPRVLSIALIDGSRHFHPKDLELLSIFTLHLSMALKQRLLQEEVQRASRFQKDYEKYLDDILSQLLSLQESERQRIDGHIIKLLPEEKASDPVSFKEIAREDIVKQEIAKEDTAKEDVVKEGIAKADIVKQKIAQADIVKEGIANIKPAEDGDDLKAILFPLEEDGSFKTKGDGEKVRVEFEEESLGMVETNGVGTAFVRTPNPLELGDFFALKLYLNDGREPLMVQGKVIWTNQYGQDKKQLQRGMGVKFVKLQAEDQKRIGDYAQKRRAPLGKVF